MLADRDKIVEWELPGTLVTSRYRVNIRDGGPAARAETDSSVCTIHYRLLRNWDTIWGGAFLSTVNHLYSVDIRGRTWHHKMRTFLSIITEVIASYQLSLRKLKENSNSFDSSWSYLDVKPLFNQHAGVIWPCFCDGVFAEWLER